MNIYTRYVIAEYNYIARGYPCAEIVERENASRRVPRGPGKQVSLARFCRDLYLTNGLSDSDVNNGASLVAPSLPLTSTSHSIMSTFLPRCAAFALFPTQCFRDCAYSIIYGDVKFSREKYVIMIILVTANLIARISVFYN